MNLSYMQYAERLACMTFCLDADEGELLDNLETASDACRKLWAHETETDLFAYFLIDDFAMFHVHLILTGGRITGSTCTMSELS